MRRAQVVLGLAVLLAVALASSPSQGAPGAKPPGYDKALAAMEKHADKWLDKQNVVGVGIGVNNAGKAVIHVYKVKDEDEGIPADVDGVAVAQLATGRIDPRAAPTDRWPRPVPIGVSSGLADFATGTLGARVTDGTHVYALSNNHVFAGVNTASIGDPITQPGPDDGGSSSTDTIATLADYQEIDFSGGDNTIDAAIALTSTGDVGTATPPDGYGTPSTTPAVATNGMVVQKYGRTTGLQQGTVQDVNLSVDVCYAGFEDFCFPGFEARFVNQISVSPSTFSAPGDSGSLMVTQGGNQPVALLFAGDGQLTIGNPIIPVLQRFDVTIEGGPPTQGPPTAPQSLAAAAGDNQVSLTWNVPSFNGGSPVTSYSIFRGTTPGGETFLTGSTTTDYVDASALNGTTYYYRVSATNANGDGPQSTEANATPIEAVAPSALPAPLDDFNRPDEPLSGSWTNAIISGESGFTISSNQLACSVPTTCTAWRNTGQFGPDVEAWARLPVQPGVGNQLRLYARLQMPGTAAGYVLRTNQLSGTDEVWLERFNGGLARILTIPEELASGDTMLLRVKGTSVEAWRQPAGGSWSRLGVVQDSTYAAAASVGVGLRGTTGRVDDFGARTIGASSPPGAPTGLAAVAGDGQVALSWTAAAFDGGSQITGHTLYRGTSPNPTQTLTTLPPTPTSYVDSTVANGTTYYYKVSASNANGDGAKSNEASATPIAAVAPATLSAPIDSFNRPNETLSDGGDWTNAIIGGEGGFVVNANQLACSVTTTCTARRNDAQYGPDVEVSTRVATPPGVSNQIRLYARLQGTTGYVLRTNQLSGTDEVWLERFNGGLTRLLTIPQELAAGDTMLLRTKGSTIEAWRLPFGGTWSRLGVVQDATYSAAAYTGIGLRGTTGRLDDFGVRTLGGPPPDTTPPTDPSGLQASAVSSSQIDLSWTASSDAVGVDLYRIERCSGPSCGNFAELTTVPGNETTFANTNLTPSTSYTYRVRAEDAASNQGGYSNLSTATTQAPPDTTPPTDPSGLQANAASSSQINLSWTASSDAVGVDLYRIDRCTGPSCSIFQELTTVPGNQTTFSDFGLSPSTSYTYRVRAEDAASNQSGYSNLSTAITLAPPDTTPPTDPSSLQASAVSSSQIDLSWSASSDAVGVDLYRIERCSGPGCGNFVEIATVPGNETTFANTSLSASTSYTYRVRAEDAASNQSGYSNVSSATTPGPPKPLFFSLLNDGTVGGVSVANEDVVSFDGATFSLAFDGSDVGLAARRIDAFSWIDADSLVFSLDADGTTLPGVAGTIDDSDVIRFDATTLGPTTAGTFSVYFDGSDVGLTTAGEDVDVFELLADGTIVLSTDGSASVPGVSAGAEDLLMFTPSSLGSTTTGAYAMYFDGSDVGISTSQENVDATAVDAAGRVYLSTTGNFSATGVSGADEDVFGFNPTALGATTSGTFTSALYFDGSAFGLGGNDIGAIDLPLGA